MTAREHLLFYGRLKGLNGKTLDDEVNEVLEDVQLTFAADRPCGNYSGGMKRRLSVANSLVGNPKVVYLDEPSTGLDPASRRTLWDCIVAAKGNDKSIVLTTHSMEEADALCDRLAIMAVRFLVVWNWEAKIHFLFIHSPFWFVFFFSFFSFFVVFFFFSSSVASFAVWAKQLS